MLLILALGIPQSCLMKLEGIDEPDVHIKVSSVYPRRIKNSGTIWSSRGATFCSIITDVLFTG